MAAIETSDRISAYSTIACPSSRLATVAAKLRTYAISISSMCVSPPSELSRSLGDLRALRYFTRGRFRTCTEEDIWRNEARETDLGMGRPILSDRAIRPCGGSHACARAIECSHAPDPHDNRGRVRPR